MLPKLMAADDARNKELVKGASSSGGVVAVDPRRKRSSRQWWLGD